MAHALVDRIIQERSKLAEMRAKPKKTKLDQLNIQYQHKYLGGLEDAASMTLPPDDIQILFGR